MKRPSSGLPSSPTGLESRFDAAFVTRLALREKQIQQSYRPIIGVHKWFARRPGTLFRSLLLAEFGEGPLSTSFWEGHRLSGVIADPFMGGGTPIYEANRLGFHVVGCDINPMAFWIVRQSLAPLDLDTFALEAASVIGDTEAEIGSLYNTRCEGCHGIANVKYFLWVKTAPCPFCREVNDLFPGYRLAEAVRHPRHVLVCAGCGALHEYKTPPTRKKPALCAACGHVVHLEGNVSRKKLDCRACHKTFSITHFSRAPEHRMWAIEYHCERCYKNVPGRQFKKPDDEDLRRYQEAEERLSTATREGATLPIPDDEIPAGDESDRLHRWGYRRYSEMFGKRQLLGLGFLLQRISSVRDVSVRHALLTVFSDTLRYQNMVCRYDTHALKCQDIFSVHGFPVGLIACENNLLGIAGIGSGSFRHFVEKYKRAKMYCHAPFETRHVGKKKEVVLTLGETIEATMVLDWPTSKTVKQALLVKTPAQQIPLEPNSLDGVFTDPPYFDNVQYAELIDFCFVWLRQALRREEDSFVQTSTRSSEELTGNDTLGRGIMFFSAGISEVFQHFARALKPGAPFVFTYHHNDPKAYLPLVLAILDADLEITQTLPAAAEMSASLHIAGTGSSVLDSVFVCRKPAANQGRKALPAPAVLNVAEACRRALAEDEVSMRKGGVVLTQGDRRCLLAGHIARITIQTLRPTWDREATLEERMRRARECLDEHGRHQDHLVRLKSKD